MRKKSPWQGRNGALYDARVANLKVLAQSAEEGNLKPIDRFNPPLKGK